MVTPTKSRVLLGGTLVRVICLQPRPPFLTPLLMRCCTYANPFKTETVVQDNGRAVDGALKVSDLHHNKFSHTNLGLKAGLVAASPKNGRGSANRRRHLNRPDFSFAGTTVREYPVADESPDADKGHFMHGHNCAVNEESRFLFDEQSSCDETDYINTPHAHYKSAESDMHKMIASPSSFDITQTHQ